MNIYCHKQQECLKYYSYKLFIANVYYKFKFVYILLTKLNNNLNVLIKNTFNLHTPLVKKCNASTYNMSK